MEQMYRNSNNSSNVNRRHPVTPQIDWTTTAQQDEQQRRQMSSFSFLATRTVTIFF
jgi:hypothetical protein